MEISPPEVVSLSISQQSAMEKIIEGIVDIAEFQNDKGNFLDFDQWRGVTCNDQNEVDMIEWHEIIGGGSLDFSWVPRTVRILSITQTDLSGSVNFAALPESVEEILIEGTDFSGEVDWVSLPMGLRSLELESNHFILPIPQKERKGLKLQPHVLLRSQKNHFTGEVMLTRLPESINILSLFGDAFVGSIELTQLPSMVHDLSLNRNQFTGEVDLRSLSPKMRSLMIVHNRLHGTVNLAHLPASMQTLYLGHNTFSGELDLSSLPETLTSLRVDTNNFFRYFESFAHSWCSLLHIWREQLFTL